MEAIACDSDMQEKSLSDLRKLATYLHDSCHDLNKNYKEDTATNGDASG